MKSLVMTRADQNIHQQYGRDSVYGFSSDRKPLTPEQTSSRQMNRSQRRQILERADSQTERAINKDRTTTVGIDAGATSLPASIFSSPAEIELSFQLFTQAVARAIGSSFSCK
jgi:hypothetical protein